ncbi:hypothetical protein BKA80DRAFT_268699 [Phyllosticta citrichinensis]
MIRWRLGTEWPGRELMINLAACFTAVVPIFFYFVRHQDPHPLLSPYFLNAVFCSRSSVSLFFFCLSIALLSEQLRCLPSFLDPSDDRLCRLRRTNRTNHTYRHPLSRRRSWQYPPWPHLTTLCLSTAYTPLLLRSPCTNSTNRFRIFF